MAGPFKKHYVKDIYVHNVSLNSQQYYMAVLMNVFILSMRKQAQKGSFVELVHGRVRA